MKYNWKDVEGKTTGVKQFGKWRHKRKDEVIKCQIKRCTKEANWITTIKGIGLIHLCFGHGEDK